MKTIFLVLAGLFLPVLSVVSQTINHPVIEKVQVLYKPNKSVPASGQASSSSPNIKVNGTASITLKNGYEATKIYLKIKDMQSQVVVYEVNYAINSSDLTDHEVIVYKKQGNIISITNPAVVTLKPYVYELYTEDAAGAKTSVYKIIQ
jgi:hypothetical protein